jgi:hypothetical protein
MTTDNTETKEKAATAVSGGTIQTSPTAKNRSLNRAMFAQAAGREPWPLTACLCWSAAAANKLPTAALLPDNPPLSAAGPLIV